MRSAMRLPPYGLWLLFPVETCTQPPQLDGRTVEVIGDAERVFTDGTFLDHLRDAKGSAA